MASSAERKIIESALNFGPAADASQAFKRLVGTGVSHGGRERQHRIAQDSQRLLGDRFGSG